MRDALLATLRDGGGVVGGDEGARGGVGGGGSGGGGGGGRGGEDRGGERDRSIHDGDGSYTPNEREECAFVTAFLGVKEPSP